MESLASLESFQGYLLAFVILLFLICNTAIFPPVARCFPPFGVPFGCDQVQQHKTHKIKTNFDGCGLH